MDDLKSRWHELASRYSDDKTLVANLWAELEKAYSGKKRHYHNLSHLEYMLERAQACKHDIFDWDTLLFSIFYHDIVYKSTRQDNEDKSAEIAAYRLRQLAVAADKISRCQQQIIATKQHQVSEDLDTNYLLDFDLAILGDTPENYKAYTQKIRKEYAIYPDFLYKRGRKKVLQHFLSLKGIFKTTPFIEQYEQTARQNLQTELASL